MWASVNTFSAASGDFAKAAAIFLSLIPTNQQKGKWTLICRNSPHSLQHHASPNRREFVKISFRPPRITSGFTKRERGFLSISPLHGIIPAIFENAKNGCKKTGNLFLISCFSVLRYSVFKCRLPYSKPISFFSLKFGLVTALIWVVIM